MDNEVIAVFDIGKTNKKILLFNAALKVVYESEEKFPETIDEDGFPCDDIHRIESWVKETMVRMIHENQFEIRAINFTTYGASVLYIDKAGKRITPLYNYLKPLPEGITDGFYEKYGGIEEFCRCTASPALAMLNVGLQILWLKRKKPEIFSKVMNVVFFPQYLSYGFTGEIVSDYTYVGCHTAMWDFDKNRFHIWIQDEGIRIPEPVSDTVVFDTILSQHVIRCGTGIHDSSASLVPYLKSGKGKFILMSTGTWCISMNPFNDEPLTTEQLRHDCLCYLSDEQQQIKSSRLFLGHMHDDQVEKLNRHFGVSPDFYKTIKTNRDKISRLLKRKKRCFFAKGILPDGYADNMVDPAQFLTYDEAYHQLMYDLCDLALDALRLIIATNDQTSEVFISGGFARNELFTKLIAAGLPEKNVYVSEIANSSALGAAIMVYEAAFGTAIPEVDLGLKGI